MIAGSRLIPPVGACGPTAIPTVPRRLTLFFFSLSFSVTKGAAGRSAAVCLGFPGPSGEDERAATIVLLAARFRTNRRSSAPFTYMRHWPGRIGLAEGPSAPSRRHFSREYTPLPQDHRVR